VKFAIFLILAGRLLRGTVDDERMCGRCQQMEPRRRTDSRRKQRSCERCGAEKQAPVARQPAVLMLSVEVSDLGIIASFRRAQATTSEIFQNHYPVNCSPIPLCFVYLPACLHVYAKCKGKFVSELN
jgi:hypothetical protein